MPPKGSRGGGAGRRGGKAPTKRKAATRKAEQSSSDEESPPPHQKRPPKYAITARRMQDSEEEAASEPTPEASTGAKGKGKGKTSAAKGAAATKQASSTPAPQHERQQTPPPAESSPEESQHGSDPQLDDNLPADEEAQQSSSSEADEQTGPGGKKRRSKETKLTREQEDEVIQFVQDNPLLYDKADLNHKDSAKRERLWELKAEKMGLPKKGIKTWFNSQRSRYGQLVRKKSGQGAPRHTQKQQWLLQKMAFIRPHIQHHVKHRPVVPIRPPEDEEEDEDAARVVVIPPAEGGPEAEQEEGEGGEVPAAADQPAADDQQGPLAGALPPQPRPAAARGRGRGRGRGAPVQPPQPPQQQPGLPLDNQGQLFQLTAAMINALTPRLARNRHVDAYGNYVTEELGYLDQDLYFQCIDGLGQVLKRHRDLQLARNMAQGRAGAPPAPQPQPPAQRQAQPQHQPMVQPQQQQQQQPQPQAQGPPPPPPQAAGGLQQQQQPRQPSPMAGPSGTGRHSGGSSSFPDFFSDMPYQPNTVQPNFQIPPAIWNNPTPEQLRLAHMPGGVAASGTVDYMQHYYPSFYPPLSTPGPRSVSAPPCSDTMDQSTAADRSADRSSAGNTSSFLTDLRRMSMSGMHSRPGTPTPASRAQQLMQPDYNFPPPPAPAQRQSQEQATETSDILGMAARAIHREDADDSSTGARSRSHSRQGSIQASQTSNVEVTQDSQDSPTDKEHEDQ